MINNPYYRAKPPLRDLIPMKIQELFLKPVQRPIDGVIKADDDRNLQTELEEYVVTRDVTKGLGFSPTAI